MVARGYGSSQLTVLEQLGGPSERVRTTRASEWSDDTNALNVIGVLCQSDADAVLLPTVPGLPDDAYEQRRTADQAGGAGGDALPARTGARASCSGTSAAAPAVSRSSGARHHPPAGRSPSNAIRTGRSGMRPQRRCARGARTAVVHGAAPAALAGLPSPDAIFIGGGATAAGVLDACWNALPSRRPARRERA